MENKANILWGIILGLAVVTLGVVYYKYRDYFDPKADFTYPFDPSCDLRSAPCELDLKDGGKVRFSISPNTIPLLKPLDLEVVVSGLDVNRVEVDFAGVDMNMGFNRNKLSHASAGRFTGQATLPVCVRSRMDWEAKVMLYTDELVINAPYRFETIK